ncbi:hypothetical protein AADZ91_18190 [Colwelliaceae bacterium 6441]
MDVNKLTNIIYDNALEFSISDDKWRIGKDRTFSKAWFKECYPNLAIGQDNKKGKDKIPGWYWFKTDAPNDYLLTLDAEKPPLNYLKTGSEKYISIKDKATANISQIKGALISDSGSRVVYNGHEIWLSGRLGGHFYSPNTKTGALRLSQHQKLNSKKYQWSVLVFSEDMIANLPASVSSTEKQQIASLIESKNSMGRRLIESNWRSLNGWPILARA